MSGKSLKQYRKTRELNPFSIQISIQIFYEQGQDFTQCVLFFSTSTGSERDWFEIISLDTYLKSICFVLCKGTA